MKREIKISESAYKDYKGGPVSKERALEIIQKVYEEAVSNIEEINWDTTQIENISCFSVIATEPLDKP